MAKLALVLAAACHVSTMNGVTSDATRPRGVVGGCDREDRTDCGGGQMSGKEAIGIAVTGLVLLFGGTYLKVHWPRSIPTRH